MHSPTYHPVDLSPIKCIGSLMLFSLLAAANLARTQLWLSISVSRMK